MLSKKIQIPLFVFVVFAFLLGACAPGAATPDAQQVADTVATAVEMTVIAKSTESALQVVPTPIPPTAVVIPTNTSVPPTPIPTNTPFTIPTTTIGGGTGSGSSGSGGGGSGSGGSGSTQTNKLDCTLVSEKPYDGQFIYKPGDSFDKVWTLKNTGTQTWEAGWSFMYISDSGTRLSPTANFTLGQDVKPGDTITLRIEIIAPNVSGREKETFVEQWAVVGDGVKFCKPYVAIFVQRP